MPKRDAHLVPKTENPQENFDATVNLMRLTYELGGTFGTEDFAVFLYALVRMQRPDNIVELGTGFGVSSFWMAHAAKQNGFGSVTTVDDYRYFRNNPDAIEKAASALAASGVTDKRPRTPQAYFQIVTKALGLTKRLRALEMEMSPDGTTFKREAFLRKPIDLLFSDFLHGPDAVLALVSFFLPRMASSSSMFIDSASTYSASFLMLELLVDHLNRGRVPASIDQRHRDAVTQFIGSHRIVLVHLTEKKNRAQNGTAWLKVEPYDVRPHPLTEMRGYPFGRQ